MSDWCYPVLNGAPDKGHVYTVQPGLGFLAPEYYAIRGMSHSGCDYNATTGGNTDLKDPVYAASDGVVVQAKNYGGWGNIVLIYHETAGVWTQYAHLFDYNVRIGQAVTMGQRIGRIGQGGRSKKGVPLFTAHLHFEVRYRYVPAYDWPSSNVRNDSKDQEDALTRLSRVDPIAFLEKNDALKTYRAVQAARVA